MIAHTAGDDRAFLELCSFAENVIKRRIEQLTEVAMVDVTGMVEQQLQIVPDPDKLAVLGLSLSDMENVLAGNNVTRQHDGTGWLLRI